MSETFERYIFQGNGAVMTHPDRWAGVEGKDAARVNFETAGVDTIASILHALDADRGLTPEEARDDPSPYAEEILARAWRSYQGDFEDIAR